MVTTLTFLKARDELPYSGAGDSLQIKRCFALPFFSLGYLTHQNDAFLQCLGAPWNAVKTGNFREFHTVAGGEFLDFWTGISGGPDVR